MKPLIYDLQEVLNLFKEKKALDMRGIGNRLIREASLGNDYAKAELGVIAYALHKIETKTHFTHSPKWIEVKETILDSLHEAHYALVRENNKGFMDALKKIIVSIRGIDDELGNFAQNIYEKAKVKQASLAYSYGLSIAQSAELTGADQKELQSYIGFTTMHDEETEVKSIGQRVKELKGIIEE